MIFDEQISRDDPFERRRVGVEDGVSMAFVDEGTGDPIVFLHGNPTSSYLWRNVLPHLVPLARCLAVDLIGYGDSDRLEGGTYRFREHTQYLDAWFTAMQFKRPITLVLHDWGTALGFDWARRHPERVKGIAYMEGIVRPLTWDEWPSEAHDILQAIRGPAGETIMIERNIWLERVLPATVIRPLTEEEMDAYRRPFIEGGENRRALLGSPRDVPIGGEPEDVARIVEEYAQFMSETPIPKLFINADPGSILVGAQREFCRTWPNQEEVTVPGIHFIQEDSPHEIGRALASWYTEL